MKTSRLLLVGFWLILLFTGCEKEAIDDNWINQEAVELNSKTVEESDKFVPSKLQNKVLNSTSLKGNIIGNAFTRKLQIYTPPGYENNGTEQYPVAYLLHGFPFTEKAFIEMDVWDEWLTPNFWTQSYPDFPGEGFRLWIDNLIAEGVIDPMIIVMPNGYTHPYGFSFYTNSELNGDFRDFIVNDLVNYMDTHYNTIPDASGRAVIGHSQGGYAAFKIGMLDPDVFGTVASHSGLLLVDALFSLGDVIKQENPDGFNGPDPNKFFTSAMYAMSAAWSPNLNNPPFYVDLPFEFDEDGNLNLVPEVVGRWYQHDIFNMLDYYHETLNSLDGVYLDVGNYDELGTNLAHQPVLQKMDAYSINYTFEAYDGGHHTNMFERLARSLEFFSDSMD